MKNMILLLGLLLFLCVSSWGACTTSNCSWWQNNSSSCGSSLGSVNALDGCNCDSYATQSHNGTPNSQVLRPRTNWIGSKYCFGHCSFWNNQSSDLIYKCDTRAEADSVMIAQKCTTGTMVKDTVGATIFDACKNGEGLLFAFNNPITGVRNSSIGYYIVTDNSADSLDEATYNHLAAQACTEVALYRGVLNGKYVYWYSTDPEPAGVVNVVRIK